MIWSFKKYTFPFKKAVTTSRDTLQEKTSYFFIVQKERDLFTGECSFIEGLSRDNLIDYEFTMQLICEAFNYGKYDKIPTNLVYTHPSIQFGLESVIAAIKNKQNMALENSSWRRGEHGIRTNGLIWIEDFPKIKTFCFIPKKINPILSLGRSRGVRLPFLKDFQKGN